MSGLYRSESMVLVRIICNEDTLYATIKQLGKFGQAHIVDLSSRRPAGSGGLNDRLAFFKKRVALAAYYERKLINFTQLFKQYKVPQPSIDLVAAPLSGGDVLEEVRAYVEPLESLLTKDILYAREQRVTLSKLQERLATLQAVGGAVGNPSGQSASAYGTFDEERKGLLTANSEAELGRLEDGWEDRDAAAAHNRQPARSYFTNSLHGIIPDDRILMFERMVFRVSRGNVAIKIYPLAAPMEDPNTKGLFIHKSVFSLMYVGDVLTKRLQKVIQFFGAVEYEVPVDGQTASRIVVQLLQAEQEAITMIKRTDDQVRTTLQAIAWDAENDTSPYTNYLHALLVEKSICDGLKKCDTERAGSTVLLMEVWIPEDSQVEFQRHLTLAVKGTGLQAPVSELRTPTQVLDETGESPPTYFRTSKSSAPYQGIVDTYGVPRYKEVNPGLFTIISFPFLFGVMYGDIGHGTLLTLAAFFLIYYENYFLREQRYGRLDEILGMVFGGRYMLIAMGLFAVYAGWIYNDCFSIMINLFGSEWKFLPLPKGADPESTSPVAVQTGVYPFGIDPGWGYTSNSLAFFNSFKMKLAVTFGVTQMTFGIILGAFNNLYFKENLSIYLEFLPRIIFMLSTFGYMIFLIIYKFCVDWYGPGDHVGPPNLVQTMIAMFLAPGQVDKDKQLYPGQAQIQIILLFLALVSVPIMLLAQPLVARAQHRAAFPDSADKVEDDNRNDDAPEVMIGASVRRSDEGPHNRAAPASAASSSSDTHVAVEVDAALPAKHGGGGGHGHGDPLSPHYNFSDHAIEQGIHTIEFVLGAVSNTASYLRLWALSLAHAELSEVFWSKMMSQGGLETHSPFLMVIGFAGWAGATFAVLMCMDVLECFLHALRLHWVEFQNKFFHADGYAYKPFSYEHLSSSENE